MGRLCRSLRALIERVQPRRDFEPSGYARLVACKRERGNPLRDVLSRTAAVLTLDHQRLCPAFLIRRHSDVSANSAATSAQSRSSTLRTTGRLSSGTCTTRQFGCRAHCHLIDMSAAVP